MHRLTARVVRERAAATGTLDQLVAGTVAVLEARLFDDSHAWSRRDFDAHLVPQIEALWKSAADESDTYITVRVLGMRGWAVRQLLAAADLTRAIDIGQRTLADCQRVLGVEHPFTMATCNNLAGAYDSVGRLDEAIPLFVRTSLIVSGCWACSIRRTARTVD